MAEDYIATFCGEEKWKRDVNRSTWCRILYKKSYSNDIEQSNRNVLLTSHKEDFQSAERQRKCSFISLSNHMYLFYNTELFSEKITMNLILFLQDARLVLIYLVEHWTKCYLWL